MKERQIIEVSSKHVVLRTVLFAAAFVIAIGSIAFGLISYTKKTPGWQEATAILDREFPEFSTDFGALVYLEGSSGEIREQLSVFNKIYTDNLKRTYKLIDCNKTYDGYINIASLNSKLGEKVKVASELYMVLQDAYKKTEMGSYSLFAGPLYRARVAIENADSYDTDFEATRINALSEKVFDLSNFTVEFYPDNYVLIDVSPSYKAFLDKYEFETPIIDLGECTYFYKTVLMDEALTNNGYPGCLFYGE